jgi:hypothetical protein
MPLEFALRPRFDLNRPAPRRRFSSLRLHPLVVPIGTYWLAAAGLTYAFIRSASVDVADAAEHGLRTGDSSGRNAAWDEPPIESPISAGVAAADIIPAPPTQEQEPAPVPVAEPLHDEPLHDEPLQDQPPAQRDLESVSRAVAENRKHLPPQPPPAADSDEDEIGIGASARSVEPKAVEAHAQLGHEPVREVEPEQNPSVPAQTGSLPSCESAAAAATQTIDLGSARGAPDLSRDAFAGVLEHGRYLARCAITPRTALEICAAVRDGKVVGVTVTTEPRDPAINACVRRAVTTLRFPRSSQLDVTRTRFERVR